MGFRSGEFSYGPDAVMAFFVLSGFVIAHVADTRENTAPEFIANRIARLWSVVLPATLLVPLFDLVGHIASEAPYHVVDPPVQYNYPLLRIFASITFTGEAWLSSIPLFSDGPIWSVNYEFFYYILFAIWTFSQGRRKFVNLVVAGIFFGPKMLLLFLPWLGGVILYRHRHRIPQAPVFGITLMLASLLILIVAKAAHFDNPAGLLRLDPILRYSTNFPWLNFVGLCMLLHLCGAWMVFQNRGAWPKIVELPVRFLASRSYSLYLLHYPVQLMVAAWLWTADSEMARLATVLTASLVVPIGIGHFAEPMRYPLARLISGWLQARREKKPV